MTTILARKAQVAGAIEAVEGTEEALAGTDVVLAYDVAFSPDVGTFKREPARATLSPLASIRGIKLGSLSFRVELKGSGSVATAPNYDAFLRACGFARTAVSTVAIGAVAGGPFFAGETITAPSGSVGRVVGDVQNGDAVLRFVPISGPGFHSAGAELVTGGTSGATATTSALPTAAQGFEYLPASSAVPSLTIGAYMDGLRHTLVGARGTVQVQTTAGEPAFLAFSFQGVYLETVDEALLSPTYDATIPPTFLGVGFVMDDAYAPCFVALGVDVGNVLEPRRCASATNGAVSVWITGRSPTATIDPELDLVANFDFYGKARSGDLGRFACEFGSTAGNVVTIASPRVQIDSIAPGDRNGIAIGTITFAMSTSSVDAGDDELQIGIL